MGQTTIQLNTELTRQRASATKRIVSKLKPLQAQISQAATLGTQLGSSTGSVADFAAELELELSLALIEAKPLISREIQSRRVTESHRKRMGYYRAPEIPSGIESGLLLGLVCFGETGTNAIYFLNNSDTFATPTAALSTAFIISATNIIMSASAGAFVGRWVNYGKSAIEDNYRSLRFWARIKLCACMGAISYFLFTIGGIRATGNLEFVAPNLNTLELILTTPSALYLVIAAGCASLLSYMKGINGFNDPDPEYGRCARQERNAHEALLHWTEDQIAELTESIDDMVEELRGDGKETPLEKRYNKLVKSCLKLKQRFDSALAEAEAAMSKHLQRLLEIHHVGGGSPLEAHLQSLHALCRFGEYRNIKMPEHAQRQDTSKQINALQKHKAKLLKQFRLALEKMIHQVEEKYR